MSIPLDKLYYYIESIAKEICNDILIYRFYPHGSKNLEDLTFLHHYEYSRILLDIPIYCHDQEPLNYDLYQTQHKTLHTETNKLLVKYGLLDLQLVNLKHHSNIHDSVILLHSELRSNNLVKYSNNGYIPVYYWCHAIIARDWYRFGYYEKLDKNIKKLFLVYNRAWAGTREYRLKFLDLLIKYNLTDFCQTSFNPVDPESNIRYTQHVYKNNIWKPTFDLINANLNSSEAHSSASADYEIVDYNSTEFEVVLETLFDDDRIQLTEKILRPIALGQPFLLAGTHGSLEYLRSYGFKTFNNIIDETYDTIEDPHQRLEAIVKCMKDIASWSNQTRKEKMALANEIALYNRNYFFSNEFSNLILQELKNNLTQGINDLKTTNTSKQYIDRQQQILKHPEIVNYLKELIYSKTNIPPTNETLTLIEQQARKNYRRSLAGK